MTKKASEQETTDIYDELFEHRVIVIDREIAEDLHTQIIGRLLLLNQKDVTKKKPIYILINSSGGDAYITLGIIDAIQSSPCPIYTVCVGTAISGAAMILAAGHKRFATKRATIMIHCHYGSDADLNHHQLLNEAKESERLNKEIVKFFVDATKLDKKKIENLLAKDSWMGSIQAKELNLIDEIEFDIFSILKK